MDVRLCHVWSIKAPPTPSTYATRRSAFEGSSWPRSSDVTPLLRIWRQFPICQRPRSLSSGPSRARGTPMRCSGDPHCRVHRRGTIHWTLGSGSFSWRASSSSQCADRCRASISSRTGLQLYIALTMSLLGTYYNWSVAYSSAYLSWNLRRGDNVTTPPPPTRHHLSNTPYALRE